MKNLPNLINAFAGFYKRKCYYVISWTFVNEKQEHRTTTMGNFDTPEEAKGFVEDMKQKGYLTSVKEYKIIRINK